MSIKIALAGNPNCGKTTLFNALTGSNQFVGNWPGVTVEKKEGKLKGHKDVIIMDLPGIYSLSPYTLEEVVARNYLITQRPDAIINIVDGTNIERNLYLSIYRLSCRWYLSRILPDAFLPSIFRRTFLCNYLLRLLKLFSYPVSPA